MIAYCHCLLLLPIAIPVAIPIASPIAIPVVTPIAIPVATPIALPIASSIATPIAIPVAIPVAIGIPKSLLRFLVSLYLSPSALSLSLTLSLSLSLALFVSCKSRIHIPPTPLHSLTQFKLTPTPLIPNHRRFADTHRSIEPHPTNPTPIIPPEETQTRYNEPTTCFPFSCCKRTRGPSHACTAAGTHLADSRTNCARLTAIWQSLCEWDPKH